MREGLSLGQLLARELRKCRNCGRAGAAWGCEGSPYPEWRPNHGMIAFGVCSQACHDSLTNRIKDGTYV